MKRGILIVSLLLPVVAWASPRMQRKGADARATTATDAKSTERLKQSALDTMRDIVPRPPFPSEMPRITNGGIRAVYGTIFRDSQVAALVSVPTNPENEGAEDRLCLLLWQDGWKFAQLVGAVSNQTNFHSTPDWVLKRHLPDGPYYVINSVDTNTLSRLEHHSWVCDKRTHSLRPTGWPKDAIPSISGNTITFSRCKKSGYEPIVRETLHFNGVPGKHIATYWEPVGGGQRRQVIVQLPDPKTGKPVTWRIEEVQNRPGQLHDVFAINYGSKPGGRQPSPEDATVDIEWDHNAEAHMPINFLLWRLTGIGINAILGKWDDDILRERKMGMYVWEIVKPIKATVTGIPEAVDAFSWPQESADKQSPPY